MSVDAALVNQNGVLFAVVAVKTQTFDNQSKRDEAQLGFQRLFPGYHIILMRQNGSRTEYYGDRNIVNFLSKVSLQQLPWKRYSYN